MSSAATAAKAGGLTTAHVDTRLARLLGDSPPWLADRRRAAWDAISTLQMPSSQQDEDWRRTDISKLDLTAFDFSAPTDPTSVHVEVPPSLKAQGVVVSSLTTAAHEHAEQMQGAFAGLGVAESFFTALWNALWDVGTFVYVPPGIQTTEPLRITHAGGTDNTVILPAVVVACGDNAALTIVEDYVSATPSAQLLALPMTLLQLGRGAEVDYTVVQRWGDHAWHVGTHRSTLAQGARLRFFGASLGSRLQKAYWETILEGAGAEADITGIALGDGTQHFDHQSLQLHRGPDTRSSLTLKVVVRDRAHSVYGGLIDVEPQAVRTNGYVQNRNLILGHGAVAASVPRLEIKANDVKCGHGSTTGHIDDEQLFYLSARGVPAAEANQLIVRGFLDDALVAVANSALRQELSELIEKEVNPGAPA